MWPDSLHHLAIDPGSVVFDEAPVLDDGRKRQERIPLRRPRLAPSFDVLENYRWSLAFLRQFDQSPGVQFTLNDARLAVGHHLVPMERATRLVAVE